MNPISSCNICGGSKTKHLFKTDRSYAESIAGRKIEGPDFFMVRCLKCGHLYLDPLPDRSFLDAFYAHYLDFGGDFYRDHFRKDYEKFEFTRQMKGRCRSIKTLIGNRRARLCDVGCGTGIFLEVARRFGFEVSGVDINPQMVRFARENFAVEVFAGHLEDAGFPSQSFDIITMWDVIEHIPFPLKLFKEVNRLLVPGGLLVMETPNINSLLHRLAKFSYYASLKKWALPISIYNIHHLHYFSPLSLKGCLEKSGFKLIKIEKGQTNLFQWLGKDRSKDNWLKRSFILRFGLPFIFMAARLLKMPNKMVVYAGKKENLICYSLL